MLIIRTSRRHTVFLFPRPKIRSSSEIRMTFRAAELRMTRNATNLKVRCVCQSCHKTEHTGRPQHEQSTTRARKTAQTALPMTSIIWLGSRSSTAVVQPHGQDNYSIRSYSDQRPSDICYKAQSNTTSIGAAAPSLDLACPTSRDWLVHTSVSTGVDASPAT